MKKLLTIALCAVLTLGMFTGCANVFGKTELDVSWSNDYLVRDYNGEEFFIAPIFTNSKSNKKIPAHSVGHTVEYYREDVLLNATPVDCGNYDFSITVTDSKYTGTKTGSFSITKRKLDIVLDSLIIKKEEAFTYKMLSMNNVDVKNSVSHTLTFNGSAEFPTEAGMYEVEIKVASSEINYKGQAEDILTIMPTDGEFIFDKALLTTYTGDAYELGVLGGDDFIVEGLTVLYNGSTTAPTDAGTYDVVANFYVMSGDEKVDYVLENTLTINKCDISSLGILANDINIDSSDDNINAIIAGEGVLHSINIELDTIPEELIYTISAFDCFGDEIDLDSIVYGGEYTIVIEAADENANYTGTAEIKVDALLEIADPVKAYQYGEYYFRHIAKHYQAKMPDGNVDAGSLGGIQKTATIRQRSTITNNFFYQTITQYVSGLQNTDESIQTYKDETELCWRQVKGKGTIISQHEAKFDGISWAVCVDEEQYRVKHADYPEDLILLIINNTTVESTSITLRENGAKTISYTLTKNKTHQPAYVNQVKVVGGQTVYSFKNLNPILTFDKYGRIIVSASNEHYDINYILTKVNIKINTSETIDYCWNGKIIKGEHGVW